MFGTQTMENKNILIIVAHPDDETIGMGGTIAKHTKNGDKVYAISMTDGVSSRNEIDFKGSEQRKKNAILASEILGFEWAEMFDFDDNELDKYPLLRLVKVIENIKYTLNPKLVYTHWSNDLNVDHRAVASAVLTAFRPQPGEQLREMRMFEIPSSTDYGAYVGNEQFNPNLFIEIDENWAKKEQALRCYGNEIKPAPHSRSLQGINNLACLRGNQVGLSRCEAFQVARKIIKI